MKSYTITVNGNVYDVVVEEKEEGIVTASPSAQPVKTKAPASVPVQKKETGNGKIKVAAGAAGKVFKIEASVGAKVEKGDTVVIIEAMKMEIPVVAPEAGTVASVDVSVGDVIEAGQVLATLN